MVCTGPDLRQGGGWCGAMGIKLGAVWWNVTWFCYVCNLNVMKCKFIWAIQTQYCALNMQARVQGCIGKALYSLYCI